MGSLTLHHVLNGDSLAEQLKFTSIRENIIVCRECLIDDTYGPEDNHDFWNKRADYLMKNYHLPRSEYFRLTVDELRRLEDLNDDAEVCLWFEDDLFCQVNMWFVISLIRKGVKISRVFPEVSTNDRWKGFSACSAEGLERCYATRVRFEPTDITLAQQLWSAYRMADFVSLKALSRTPSACFRLLEEVCQAHIDRFPADGSPGRPERTLLEIMKSKPRGFTTVFREFSSREGIYGFGDLQIRPLYERIVNEGKPKA